MSYLQKLPFELLEAIFENCSVMSMLTMGAATEAIVKPSTLRNAVVEYFERKHKQNRIWSVYLGSEYDFVWRVNEPMSTGVQTLWLARQSDPLEDNEMLDENFFIANSFNIEAPEWSLVNMEIARDEFYHEYW